VVEKIEAGELNLGKTYRRLRSEYMREIMRFMLENDEPDGAVLCCRREDGRFVFSWGDGGA
jgi:hypothetical protein